MVSRTDSATALVSRPSAISNPWAAAALSTRGGVVFLYSYMLFHAAHVAGSTPWFVTRLSRIPLFGTCAASALLTLATVLMGSLAVPATEKELARLPSLLTFAVVLFTLEIVLFP